MTNRSLSATAYGRLLNKLKKSPMTHRQMTSFLLGLRGYAYIAGLNHDHYNSSLYGTRSRQGILERFAHPWPGHRWIVDKSMIIAGPFTPKRQNSSKRIASEFSR